MVQGYFSIKIIAAVGRNHLGDIVIFVVACITINIIQVCVSI